MKTSNRSRHRVERLVAIAESRGYRIALAPGCCEPGYSNMPVALANWNTRSTWKHPVGITDNTMPRIANLFARLGYMVEWEDEWATCMDCNHAFRVCANSPRWRPSFTSTEDGIQCCKCSDL